MHAFLLLLSVAAAQPSGGPPIEGDARLLQLLRSAQQTNSTLYPRGQLHAKVVSGRSDDERRHRHVDAIVIWDADKTYWEYSSRRSLPREDVTGKTVWIESDRSGRMIQTASLRAAYNATGDLLVVTRGPPDRRNLGYPAELDLRPDRSWFHCWGMLGKTRDWIEYMGPHPALTQDNVSKYVIRRADDDRDRIIVEQRYKPGYVLRIEASLAVGGNVVAYKGSGRGSPLESEGRYEWAQHPSGVWYVKKHQFRRWHKGNVDRFYSLEVTSFEPNPQILPNQFELNTLSLKPGTMVRELSGTKIVRQFSFASKGETEQEQQSRLQSLLDELAQELGSKGFAVPKKD